MGTSMGQPPLVAGGPTTRAARSSKSPQAARLTTLYNFCSQPNCTDGDSSVAGLVQASDGNLLRDDATWRGLLRTEQRLWHGLQNHPKRHADHAAQLRRHGDGKAPFAGLVQATDGNFYGTTAYGANPACTAGLGGCGTVFRLSGPPPSTTTVTSSPNPSTFGQQVTITATVGPAGPPAPTGTVGFTSNGAGISGCTAVPLNSSLMAVCMTSTLAVGTDAIVARIPATRITCGSSGMFSQIVNPVPSPVQFVPLTPCRVVDTRNPNGHIRRAGHSGRCHPAPFPLVRERQPLRHSRPALWPIR